MKFTIDTTDEYGKVNGTKEVKVLGFVAIAHEVHAVVSDGVGYLETKNVRHVKEMQDDRVQRVDAPTGSVGNDRAVGSGSTDSAPVEGGVRAAEEAIDSSPRQGGTGGARSSKSTQGRR